MENITEILKKYGLEVPADKQADFQKDVAANYKTAAEFDKKLGKLEAERDAAKEELTAAKTTLAKLEGVDVEGMKKEIADWKTKAENAEKDYAAKIAQQEFDALLATEMEGYKFTSKAAKETVAKQIRESGLKTANGKILGLSDFMATIKEADPEAFASAENPPAKFTAGKKSEGGKKYASRDEILKIKNTAERQQAMADNPGLFGLDE